MVEFASRLFHFELSFLRQDASRSSTSALSSSNHLDEHDLTIICAVDGNLLAVKKDEQLGTL